MALVLCNSLFFSVAFLIFATYQMHAAARPTTTKIAPTKFPEPTSKPGDPYPPPMPMKTKEASKKKKIEKVALNIESPGKKKIPIDPKKEEPRLDFMKKVDKELPKIKKMANKANLKVEKGKSVVDPNFKKNKQDKSLDRLVSFGAKVSRNFGIPFGVVS